MEEFGSVKMDFMDWKERTFHSILDGSNCGQKIIGNGLLIHPSKHSMPSK